MFAKKMMMAAGVSAALFAGVAGAADTQEYRFAVTATVPSVDFYIVPELAWHSNTPVELAWNPNTSNFGAKDLGFKFKSTASDLNAKVLAPAQLVNATNDQLDLVLTMGGVRLDQTSKKVADKSALETRLALNLQVAAGTHEPGVYAGTVSILFEASEP